MAGLFNTGDATAMFRHLQIKWVSFYSNPTEEGLIDTLFPMNHLREWIVREEYSDEQVSAQAKILDEQLWAMEEYKIVNSLCNHTKHYKPNLKKNPPYVTTELKGARAGLMKCGDPLDVSHFMVDGREVRDIFIEVYRIYYAFFEPADENDCQAYRG